MRPVPQRHWDIWHSGDFVGWDGNQRPVTRATVERRAISDWDDLYRSYLFAGDVNVQRVEIPNIQTVNIQRSLDADAGSMTMTILNQVPAQMEYLGSTTVSSGLVSGLVSSTTRKSLGNLGQPGFYTYSRGTRTEHVNRWGQGPNATWANLLIPNRLVRTYQGYGQDLDSLPHADPNLVLTGLWLIDKVDLSTNGTITLHCRDAAKLLIEQRLFPPIVPPSLYPLDIYGPDAWELLPGERGVNLASRPTDRADSSGALTYGNNHEVYGHRASDVFDGDSTTYWLSLGHDSAEGSDDFEWIEANVYGFINQIRFKPKWGGYRVYVALWGPPRIDELTRGLRQHAKWIIDSNNLQVPKTAGNLDAIIRTWYGRMGTNNTGRFTTAEINATSPTPGIVTHFQSYSVGDPQAMNDINTYLAGLGLPQTASWNPSEGVEQDQWHGRHTVPYVGDNQSNVPFLISYDVPFTEQPVTIPLPGILSDVKFWDGTEVIEPTKYWATAIRLIFTRLQDSGLPAEGSLRYRAAISELQAFVFIPSEIANTLSVMQGSIADYVDVVKLFCAWSGFWWPTGPRDPLFVGWSGHTTGRVWGDFHGSGAYPVDPAWIPASFWDNKSVMEAINAVREIIGFVFYVDSTGGVVFREPNIWNYGNYVTYQGYVPGFVPHIDEKTVLLDLGTTIDDQNLRSELLVQSYVEDVGVLAASYSPVYENVNDPVFGNAFTLTVQEILANQQRIMAAGNYPFLSQDELDKFAYLVTLWMHWTMRTSRFRVPGIAAFEPDDQVRVFERITAETNTHYVSSVSSEMDLIKATWFLDIETHWLGESPFNEWVVNRSDMNPTLRAWLVSQGYLVDEEGNIQTPETPPYVGDEPRDDSGATDPDEGDGGQLPDPPEPNGSVSNRLGQAWLKKYWGNPGNLAKKNVSCAKWWSGSGRDWVFVNSMFAGRRIQTNEFAVPIWRRLEKAFYQAGVDIVSVNGSYNCRGVKVNGIESTTRWSAHTWGLAIDINADIWPQGVAPSAAAQAVWAIAQNITVDGKQALGWGGLFSTPDPMHFQVILTPKELVPLWGQAV